MKFLFSRDIRENSFLKSMMLFWFLMLLVFIVFNLLFEMSRFGITPAQIRISVLGDPSLYIQPKDLSSLLTEIHTQLFIYSIAFIMCISIFVHTRVLIKLKILFIWILALAILLDSASILGLHFLSPFFSYIKAFSFLIIEMSFLLVSISLIIWLLRTPYAPKK